MPRSSGSSGDARDGERAHAAGRRCPHGSSAARRSCMVATVAHDSSPPPPLEVSASQGLAADEPARCPRWPRLRALAAGIGAVGCRDVPGFREAALAAQDPRAPTPARIALVGPDDAAYAWLERWAEDVEQVRRSLTVRRADGAEITLVATIASFGEGIATSLAVESVGPLGGGAVLRSGVHSRAEVEAVLAHYERAHAAPPPVPALGEPADAP